MCVAKFWSKMIVECCFLFCLFVLTCFFLLLIDPSDLQYPNGDSDAITIKKPNYKTLEPKQFLNDTILDFYLK